MESMERGGGGDIIERSPIKYQGTKEEKTETFLSALPSPDSHPFLVLGDALESLRQDFLCA